MTSLLMGILGNVGKMLTEGEGKNVNNWRPEFYILLLSVLVRYLFKLCGWLLYVIRVSAKQKSFVPGNENMSMVSGNWGRGWLCFHCSVSALCLLFCENVFYDIVFSQTFVAFTPIVLRNGGGEQWGRGGKKNPYILFQDGIRFCF